MLDMYVALGLLDHDPYWAALWPSSIALARGRGLHSSTFRLNLSRR